MGGRARFSDEAVRRVLVAELIEALEGCSIATLANLATIARRESDPIARGRFRGAQHYETYRGRPVRSRREED